MAILIVPEIDELYYRKKLLENRRTMETCGGPVPFGKDRWQSFMDETVHAAPDKAYYAYIFCRSCEDFVGSVEYAYDETIPGYRAFVLVESSQRQSGYGTEGVRLLREKAAENGIRTLYAEGYPGAPWTGFLNERGFQEVFEDGDRIIYQIATED